MTIAAQRGASAGTRAVLERYLASQHTDLGMMAHDVVFTTMATGEEHHGREQVRAMLHHIYHVAFDAHAEVRTLVCEDAHAVLEGLFVGRHTGHFAGIAPTGREVRVPLCVVYDLTAGEIRRARVYLELPVMMQQLGVG
ncbi:MAG: ester cyclase [Gemmatimonadota bacterium]|nr:ester cyclase [Gemmatimonadota bacterium]